MVNNKRAPVPVKFCVACAYLMMVRYSLEQKLVKKLQTTWSLLYKKHVVVKKKLLPFASFRYVRPLSLETLCIMVFTVPICIVMLMSEMYVCMYSRKVTDTLKRFSY